MTIRSLLTALTLALTLATAAEAMADVRFVANPGYRGPRRVGVNATPYQAPRGYVPRGPVRHSMTQFRDYLTAKSRGIYDPGYAGWLRGNGVVRRR